MMKVAVVGASGFIGATVVERLLARNSAVVLPLIHSSGNAWRLARRGLDLKPVSLLDRPALKEALRGCTHVVNCSRGGNDVMIAGLRNLLAESKSLGVRRFVHLSSVAVYGDPPPPESASEDAPTRPKKGSYGAIKLVQDEMVAKAANEGLPAIVLCPPNISGPHSYFLTGLLGTLRERRFALADSGEAPCVLVDVVNLAHAIELALEGGIADGRRLFVTDDEPVSWRNVVDALLPLVGSGIEVPSMPREELEQRWRKANDKPKSSVMRSLTHLLSGEVRQALRRDPLWEQVDTFARGLATKLGSAAEERIRLAVAGPLSVAQVTGEPAINVQLSGQQLRGVRHSCDRAKQEIGYRPLYSFSQSMQAFGIWHRRAQGMDGEFADLLLHLG